MSAYDTFKAGILGDPFDANKKPSRQGAVQGFLELQTQVENIGEIVLSESVTYNTVAEGISATSVGSYFKTISANDDAIYEAYLREATDTDGSGNLAKLIGLMPKLSSLDEKVDQSVFDAAIDQLAVVSNPVKNYNHPLSAGDRTTEMRAFSKGLFRGSAELVFNGVLGGTNQSGVQFTSTNLNEHEVGFNAGNGRRIIPNEIKIWISDGTTNLGVFNLVGRQDNGPDEVLASIDLLGANRSADGTGFLQTVTVPVVKIDGIERGYSQLSLVGASGSFTAVPWMQEIEFSLGNAVDDKTYLVPSFGLTDQVLTKTSDESNDLVWTNLDFDIDGASARGIWKNVELSKLAELRSGSTFFISSRWGDDANFGHSGTQARSTVDGLFPKSQLIKGNIVKTTGFTSVYEIEIDKGVNYHRDSVIGLYIEGSNTRTDFANVSSITDVDNLANSYFDQSPGARFTKLYFRTLDVSENPGNPITDANVYVIQQACPFDAGIGVAAGSIFKGGNTFEPTRGFKRVGVFGRGELPYFDCTRLIDENDFVASDHIDATSNVFETTVLNETGVRQLNDPEHQIFQTDPNGLRYSLKTVNSVSEVAARAGTVYFGTIGDENTSARSNKTTALAFVHPRFSVDPTDQSGGEIYEFSYTKSAISINGQNGADSRNNIMQGCIVEGLIARGQVDGQGSIVTNEDAFLKRVMMMDGNKHAFVGVTGRVEDCIFFQNKSDPIAGPIPSTFYRADAEGIDGEYTRTLFIKPDHQRDGGNGFITHGSSGTLPDKHHLEQVVMFNGGTVVFAGLDLAVCNDALCLSGPVHEVHATKALLDAAAISSTPSDRDIGAVTNFDGGNNRTYVWNGALSTPAYEPISNIGGGIQTATPNATKDGNKTFIRRAIFDCAQSTQLINIPSSGGIASTTALVDIRHCAFKMRDTYPGIAIRKAIAIPTIVKNNTFVLNDFGIDEILSLSTPWNAGNVFSNNIMIDFRSPTGGFQRITTVKTDGGIVSGEWDYNVYVIANSKAFCGIYVDNIFYSISSAAEWAAYQSAVASKSVDANSIVLFDDDWKKLFAGDPKTGDYRLRKGDLKTYAGDPIVFADGSPVNTNAGIQEYFDWNKQAVLNGQMRKIPQPPKTEAECKAYVQAPWDWIW